MDKRKQILLLLLLGHVAAFTPNALQVRVTSTQSLTAGHTSSGFRLGPLYLRPGRPAPVVNDRYITSEMNNNKDRTEVSRMKFMINQLKGSAQESEMRADAAENRVAMLQLQIIKLESAKVEHPEIEQPKEDNDNDDASNMDQAILDKTEKEHEKKVGKLNKAVTKVTNALNIFKTESSAELESTKERYENAIKQWEAKYNDLQLELKQAGGDLEEAREEASNLKKQIKALVSEMAGSLQDLRGQLVAEIKEVASKKDDQISVLKVEAENMRTTLLEVNEKLELKLTASQDGSKALMQDLERAKMELTNELISFKEKTRKELDSVEESLQRKEAELQNMSNHIDALETERISVRKLFRAQRSLVGKRISKRFRKK